MKVAVSVITTLLLFICGWIITMVQAQDVELDTLRAEFQEEKLQGQLRDQKFEFNQELILDILKQRFPEEAEIADTNVRNNLNNHAEAKIETVYYYVPVPEDTN